MCRKSPSNRSTRKNCDEAYDREPICQPSPEGQMTPNDIQAIVDGIARDGLYFRWWIQLIVVVVMCVSAYFGAYLSRKAQDRAANENFERLSEQLRKTTGDVERIKNSILSESWYRQQQWSRREQHYLGLLESLTKMRIALTDCGNYFLEPGDEYEALPDAPAFKEASELATLAAKEVRQRAGPATIFLSAPAVEALKKLEFDHWHLSHFDASSPADYYVSAITLAEVAYETLLDEAKSQLKGVENLGSV